MNNEPEHEVELDEEENGVLNVIGSLGCLLLAGAVVLTVVLTFAVVIKGLWRTLSS